MCNLFNFLLTAIGDPLGGCRVTPYGYSVMLKKVGIEVNSPIVCIYVPRVSITEGYTAWFGWLFSSERHNLLLDFIYLI